MTDKQLVIRESVDANAALDLIVAMTNGGGATVEQKLYYPYFRFDGRCSVPTLFGRQATEITCLVDAVNGLGATADNFLVDHCQMPGSELIGVEISSEEAARAARRTVTHRLNRRLRVIASFDLDLVAKGVVYRGFWIVRSESVYVMVDSVNGGLHPLRLRAA